MAARRRRLKFRSWHRGTKEADLLIGGFCDRHLNSWGEDMIAWYESLLEEQDVDIMAWAIGTQPVPERFQGAAMDAMKVLDYIPMPEKSAKT
ncbi:succinate dehydrogenase assembly factor 2 [Pacificimonas sp. WHA3]|uniref:Succinate dehydrogenase assembly factor 2 n=1 Tax=Pacificimonas pallii TaxID=2827236 RepID=A0ABS6SEU1_9SPHN|nr:succinate dehydrogenase assembly factor 2 [Pacificimonas pallii]MBV7256909.1 succinate dehydrogenase assembly factor 2 [Pacificimonas pallii]